MHRVGLWTATWTVACTGTGTPGAEVQHGVELHVLPFVDTSRPTEAYDTVEASDVRALETWVWLPAGPVEPRPVVLIAHGILGHPEKFELLAELLAEDGWVVAGPVFPATNRDGSSFAVPDLVNQPDDLDFVLEALRGEGSDTGSPLFERVDVDRTLAVGHSLGGATVSGWTRWGEAPRADLAGTVLLAPATFLNGVFGEGPHAEGPPVLLIHGEDDPLVPVSMSESLYEAVDGPAALAVLPDNGHSEPFEGETPGVLATAGLIDGLARERFEGEPGAWLGALDEGAADGARVEHKGL